LVAAGRSVARAYLLAGIVMKGVIRSSDALSAKVRLFSAPHQTPVLSLVEQAADEERAALFRQVEQLSAEIEHRDREIATLRGERDRAFEAGQVTGREAGLKEGDTLRADALERLTAGVRQAVDLYDRSLASLERLAVLIAHESLDKLLRNPGDRQDLLAEIIGRQVGGLDAQAVLNIEVSAHDFPTSQDLADLAAGIGRRGVDLSARPDLKTGDCRIRLVLGSLEVGIDQQWGRLGALLRDLASPEGDQ